MQQTNQTNQTKQARDWYRPDLVAEGIARSGKPRESLFLTTKVHPRDLGAARTRAAFERAVKALRSKATVVWAATTQTAPGRGASPGSACCRHRRRRGRTDRDTSPRVEREPEPKQVSHPIGLELLHQPGTMDLHGALRDAELLGNLAVVHAVGDTLEHLGLTVGQTL